MSAWSRPVYELFAPAGSPAVPDWKPAPPPTAASVPSGRITTFPLDRATSSGGTSGEVDDHLGVVAAVSITSASRTARTTG